MNPVGIISMQFKRPISDADLPLVDRIAALGFDFVELLVPEPEDGLHPGRWRAALEGAGLGVVLAARVNLQRSIASDDPAARRGGIGYLDYCIEVASEIGATVIGGPLYGEPMVFAGRAPVPHDDGQIADRAKRTIDGLAEVAPRARAAGRILGLEPLNRFETDIVSTTRQGIEVVDAVGDPGLGLVLDTFHMNMEDDSIPGAIRAAGERIVHFQANENHRGFPGSGHIDWPSVMAALAEVGYDGPVSLEPFRRNDDRVGLPIAHWRSPREDETEKLKAGLAYVRARLAEAAS